MEDRGQVESRVGRGREGVGEGSTKGERKQGEMKEGRGNGREGKDRGRNGGRKVTGGINVLGTTKCLCHIATFIYSCCE